MILANLTLLIDDAVTCVKQWYAKTRCTLQAKIDLGTYRTHYGSRVVEMFESLLNIDLVLSGPSRDGSAYSFYSPCICL
jgi:hypothetical protein